MKDKKFLESKKAWYFIAAAVFGLIGLGIGAYWDGVQDALTWYMIMLATTAGGGSVSQGLVDRVRVNILAEPQVPWANDGDQAGRDVRK